MDLFFGFVLLVLAVGIVLLFAMFGELASRVGEAGRPGRSTDTSPVDEVPIGRSAKNWPPELDAVASAHTSQLIVLSTVCTTCQDVASQLDRSMTPPGGGPVGVVITGGSQASGRQFVEDHGLEWMPNYVDEGGEWVRTEFNVQASPTGLAFVHGQLAEARLFEDVGALMVAQSKTLSQHQHESEQKLEEVTA